MNQDELTAVTRKAILPKLARIVLQPVPNPFGDMVQEILRRQQAEYWAYLESGIESP